MHEAHCLGIKDESIITQYIIKIFIKKKMKKKAKDVIKSEVANDVRGVVAIKSRD